jgi:hypothetical protein
MTFTQEQVERIVLEVIRRLEMLGPSTASPGTDLAISERIVTMRLIEGRLSGVSRLIVGPRTVITPAVRDELNERHIELVRQPQS